MKSFSKILITTLFIVIPSAVAWGQTTTRFNDGYISVMKTSNASTASAVTAEEYTPTTASQSSANFSVAVPSTTGGSTSVTVTGNSTTMSGMTRSYNGRYLAIPGYRAAVGAANTTYGDSTAVRTIDATGTVGAGVQGHWNTANGSNFRGAVTDDLTNYWLGGNGTGIMVTQTGTTTTISTTNSTNNRFINIFGFDQLYYATGSTSIGIYAVGTGLPTSSTTSRRLFTNNASNTNPIGFAVSPDTLTAYMADGTNGIFRYTYSGGAWSGGTAISGAGGTLGLAVDWSGYSFSASSANGAKIYFIKGTGAADTLRTASDNGTSALSTTTLRIAGTAEIFHGVTFSPIKQTVSKGSNPPATGNITQGTTDVVLFQFNLSADEGNSTMKKVVVAQTGTATIGSGNDISNFRLIDDANGNGVADAGELASPLATGTVSGSNIIFSSITLSSYIAQGSSENFLVVGDVGGSATVNNTFIPSIVSNKSVNSVNYTTNLTNAGGSFVTISATPPTGNILTVQAPPVIYRSVASGNWNSTSTWESSADNGTTFSAAASTPTSSDGVITVRSPNTVTVTAGVNVDQVTIDAGGTVSVSTGVTLTVDNGAGTDVTVNGTVDPASTAILSGAGSIAVNSGGTIRVAASTFAGNYAQIGGTTLNSGSTVEYTGSGNQTVDNTLSYSNLTINKSLGTASLGGGTSVSGTLTLTSGALDNNGFDLYVQGNVTNNSSFTGSGTLELGGVGHTLFGNGSYSNLELNDASGASLSGSPTVTDTLKLENGGFTIGANTLTINGVITIGIGNLVGGSTSNITFGGSGASTTLPTVALNELTLDRANGISLGGDLTITGTLTFTSGNITTGTYTVTIGSLGIVNRTIGHVVGNLQKNVGTGTPTLTFEIGDANSDSYSPVDLSFANVTTAGDLTAKVTSGDHPNLSTSGIDANKSVNRYWSLTNSGIAFGSASATFNFESGNIDVGADPNNFIVGKYDAPSWSLPTVGTRNPTNTQATGLTSFSDFAVGEGAPLFSVSPSSVSFGSVNVSSSKTDSVTVTNTGTDTLSISSVTSDSSEFTVTPTSSGSIAPSDSQKFTITFTPTSTGTKSGNIVFTHNAAGSPTSVPVSGVGILPGFLVTPGSLAFGNVLVASSKRDSVTVKNTGSTPLTISSAVSNNSQFTVTPDSGTISQSDSLKFYITLTPTSAGLQSGDISFTHNAAGSPSMLPVSGTGVFQAQTAPGNALSFDGVDDYVSSSVVTTAIDNVTMEAWVKWDGPTSGNAFIIYNGNPSDNTSLSGYGIFLDVSASPSFSLSILCAGVAVLNSSTPLSVGVWHHVAAVRNSGIWGLYLDGAQQGLNNSTATPIVPSGLTTIGTWRRSVDFFNGTIDEVRIWNVARTAAQVLHDAYSSLAGNESGLAAYWRFDEGSGTTTSDATGNGNTGMLFNAPTWVTSTAPFPASVFTVSPTSVEFGSVTVESSKQDSVTVTNIGGAALDVSAVSDNTEFTVTPISPSVAPSDSQKFTITLSPTSTGTKVGHIIFTHNAAGSPDTVTVSGAGVTPVFSVSPSSVSFGSVNAGSSKLDSVTVTNTGTATLVIDSVKSNNSQFTATPTSGSVAISDSQKFTITFSPTSGGAKTGKIIFTHNPSSRRDTVDVSGFGIPGTFSVSPSSKDFDTVRVGSSKIDSVTVTNTGTGTLTISSVASNNSQFTVTPTSRSVAISDSQKFTITFSPTSSGVKSGNILFTHDGASSPDTVRVSGIGIPVNAQPPTINPVTRSTRVPLAGESVVVTAIIVDSIGIVSDSLLYAVNGGTPIAVAMVHIGGTSQKDTSQGVIPGSVNADGNRIEYQIKAVSASHLIRTTAVAGANSYFAGTSPLSLSGVKAINANRQILYKNYYARVTGTVNGPNFQTTNTSYFFQDSVGGMDLFFFGLPPQPLNLGDSIEVVGFIDQFRGTTEITPADPSADVVIIDVGRPLSVIDLTISQFRADPEPSEGRLIRFTGVYKHPSSPAWPGADTSRNMLIYQTSTSDSVVMRIDSDTELDGSPEPTYPIKVTGVAGQNTSSTSVFNDGYQILPRYRSDDLVGVSDQPRLPTVFVLEQNYPNPFNPTTQIKYALPKESYVTLKVFNILGQEVVTLLDAEQVAGYHVAAWDGRNNFGSVVGSGIYFYRIEAKPKDGNDAFIQVKKMLMLK